MIKVSNLTKKYAGITAVDQISFNVERGEVVGFLGPNGAGKTTTMRILCGYISASAGSASVAGYDVYSDSLEVRQHIGYLPEHCPLYLDMRVKEYLRYRASLKGVPRKQRKSQVTGVMEKFDLWNVRKRIIGTLSKGYRQRVGLADALVHDPDLLILDEPTLGLDPHQNREVRMLIKQLAKTQTILLSTHILSEVEMVCDRVLIINRGEIAASDTPWGLRHKLNQGGRIIAEVKGSREEISACFSCLIGVEKVEFEVQEDWVRVILDCEKNADLRDDVYRLSVENGWLLRELKQDIESLEDVFIRLTSRHQPHRVLS